MRRTDREITSSEAMELLAQAKHGVLSMIDADGGPYAVPVNHAVVDGCIIIHCAVRGRKLDNLRKDVRVCYTVYNSATKHRLLAEMTERLAPGATFACSDETVANTGVIRIKVDNVTGKANR